MLNFGSFFIQKFEEALAQRRGFLMLPFFIILGLLLNCSTQFDPNLYVLFALGIICTIIVVLSVKRGQFFVYTVWFWGLWLGFSILSAYGMLSGTSMLKWPVFGSYRAEISKVISRSGEQQRIIIQNITVQEGRDPMIRRARIFVRGGPTLERGMIVEGKMRLSPVPTPAVPGGYDPQFHGYFAGIGAYGNTTGQLTIVDELPRGPLYFLDRVREAIGVRIDAAMQGPSLGIARALIIGDQRQIDQSTRKTMSAAGLAHVLAISGLHLSLVAGGIFIGTRFLLAMSYKVAQVYSPKKIAAVFGIAAALFYLAISGASVSATRATVTLILIFGAILVERRALTMRNVAFASLFVLLTDPASVFRPGFQLSFAAVAALVGVYEMTAQSRADNDGFFSKFFKFFLGTGVTSLVAGAATALFAAYHFQQTAPLGVLGNVVALPLVGFVVLPAAVGAVLSMPLGFEKLFLNLMGWGIDQILTIAHTVAKLAEPIDYSPVLLPSALIFGFLGLAWFVFFASKLRFLGPAVALIFVAFLSVDQPPDVLIADSSKAVAVRTSDGLSLVTGRTNSFISDVWQSSYQENISQGHDDFGCDRQGCIVRNTVGGLISVPRSSAAVGEDCDVSILLISRDRVPEWCKDVTQVIDQDDLKFGGVHWLKWNTDLNRYDVRRAITDPNRAWRMPQ